MAELITMHFILFYLGFMHFILYQDVKSVMFCYEVEPSATDAMGVNGENYKGER